MSSMPTEDELIAAMSIAFSGAPFPSAASISRSEKALQALLSELPEPTNKVICTGVYEDNGSGLYKQLLAMRK